MHLMETPLTTLHYNSVCRAIADPQLQSIVPSLTSPLVPASNGGRSPSWAPELFPSHSHGVSQSALHLLELPALVSNCLELCPITNWLLFKFKFKLYCDRRSLGCLIIEVNFYYFTAIPQHLQRQKLLRPQLTAVALYGTGGWLWQTINWHKCCRFVAGSGRPDTAASALGVNDNYERKVSAGCNSIQAPCKYGPEM
jgi:hypothetical protein